jgi:hypothetical protein
MDKNPLLSHILHKFHPLSFYFDWIAPCYPDVNFRIPSLVLFSFSIDALKAQTDGHFAAFQHFLIIIS